MYSIKYTNIPSYIYKGSHLCHKVICIIPFTYYYIQRKKNILYKSIA